jgi:hypothetical protein
MRSRNVACMAIAGMLLLPMPVVQLAIAVIYGEESSCSGSAWGHEVPLPAWLAANAIITLISHAVKLALVLLCVTMVPSKGFTRCGKASISTLAVAKLALTACSIAWLVIGQGALNSTCAAKVPHPLYAMLRFALGGGALYYVAVILGGFIFIGTTCSNHAASTAAQGNPSHRRGMKHGYASLGEPDYEVWGTGAAMPVLLQHYTPTAGTGISSRSVTWADLSRFDTVSSPALAPAPASAAPAPAPALAPSPARVNSSGRVYRAGRTSRPQAASGDRDLEMA